MPAPRRLAVLALPCLLLVGSFGATAASAQEQIEGLVRTTSLRFAPGSPSANGYAFGSMDVRYRFLSCGRVLHVAYAPQGGRISAALQYWHNGEMHPVPDGVAPPVYIGSVGLDGEAVRAAIVVGTFGDGAASMGGSLGCWSGNTKRIGPLPDFVRNASAGEVANYLNSLVARFTTPERLLNGRVVSALAEQRRAAERAEAERAEAERRREAELDEIERQRVAERAEWNRQREAAQAERDRDAAQPARQAAQPQRSAAEERQIALARANRQRAASLEQEGDRLFEMGLVMRQAALARYREAQAIFPTYDVQQKIARIEAEVAAAELVSRGFDFLDVVAAEFSEMLDDMGVPTFAGVFFRMHRPMSGPEMAPGSTDGFTLGAGTYRVLAAEMRAGYAHLPAVRYHVRQSTTYSSSGTIDIVSRGGFLGFSVGVGLPFGRYAPYGLVGGDAWIVTPTPLPGEFRISEDTPYTSYDPFSLHATLGLNYRLSRRWGVGIGYTVTDLGYPEFWSRIEYEDPHRRSSRYNLIADRADRRESNVFRKLQVTVYTMPGR